MLLCFIGTWINALDLSKFAAGLHQQSPVEVPVAPPTACQPQAQPRYIEQVGSQFITTSKAKDDTAQPTRFWAAEERSSQTSLSDPIVLEEKGFTSQDKNCASSDSCPDPCCPLAATKDQAAYAPEEGLLLPTAPKEANYGLPSFPQEASEPSTTKIGDSQTGKWSYGSARQASFTPTPAKANAGGLNPEGTTGRGGGECHVEENCWSCPNEGTRGRGGGDCHVEEHHCTCLSTPPPASHCALPVCLP